jgi:hypothetical protein
MRIRWGKMPHAHQLVRLGAQFTRAGQLRSGWMSHYFRNGQHATFTYLRSFWDQPADVLVVVAPLRFTLSRQTESSRPSYSSMPS